MNKFRDLGFVSYRGSSIEVHSALLSVLFNDKPQPHKKSPAETGLRAELEGIGGTPLQPRVNRLLVARKCPASKRG
jgi:hypothetical protein